MRILMLAEFFPSLENPVISGGVEARCFQVAKRLAQKHTITIFARNKQGELALEKQGNLHIYRFGGQIQTTVASFSSLFSRLGYVITCIWKARHLKVDLVEGSNFVTYMPAFIIGRIKKSPVVVFYPDVFINRWRLLFGNILGIIGEITERLFIRFPWTKYIAISKSVAKRLSSCGVNPDKITIISCGIKLTHIAKAKFDHNKLIVISRLLNYKRVDWVIKLLKELESEFPKLKLTVVGTGSEEGKLKALVSNLKLDQKVIFLKNLTENELHQTLSTSKLLIHPSLVEGFGIVLVEANALGVPFVASDIPTSLELVKALEGGALFKQSDFNDMVVTVKELLKNKQKWHEMQASGIENAEKFSWERIVRQTEQLYQKELAKKGN